MYYNEERKKVRMQQGRVLKKEKFKKILSCLAILMCIVMLFGQTMQVSAATAQESTSKNPVTNIMTTGGNLSRGFVGRYKFKYIGNTNYYQFFDTDGEKFDSGLVENSGSSKAKKAAKAVLGKSITNSSAATLKKGGNGKIKAAYLVWQTRSSDGANSAIALVDGSGKAKKISAKSAVVDNRRGTHSLYNMYADVTSFVTDGKGKGKYGTYTVCNIPIWERELESNGESMASWELIVLEEGDNYPIRACSLTMTSTFSLNDNYDAIKVTTDLPLGGKLKTRADDGKAVTGQLFFGYSTSNNSAEITKTFTMENGTTSKGSISETDTAGKKVGGNNCVRMSLSSFSEKKFYDATSGAFSIKGKSYTNDWGIKVYPYATFFLLGIAVDVAQPTFSGQQTTTINTDGTVNVSATGGNVIKNTTTKQGDTGYYDGTFTVMLDNALEPVDTGNIKLSYYNNADKKTYAVSGTYNNHVVTFDLSGKNYRNYTNGSYLSYDIQCKVVDQNAAEYNNSHQLDGYLYSRGATTGVQVENMHSSSSSAKLEGYTVHYDGNGGDASNIPDQTCRRDTYYQITTEEPQREGYTFAKSWYTPDSTVGSGYRHYSSGSSFINLANIGETKTLYAEWYNGDDYIVHFDPNGGTGTMSDMECDWNTSYQYPQNGFTAPVVNGETLHFVGWALGRKSTSISKPGATFRNLAGFNSREVTLYAIWSPYYKVMYNNYKEFGTRDDIYLYSAGDILRNEQLSEMLETQVQTRKYNSVGMALTADGFTQPKNGKVFKAWYTTEQLWDISSANAQIKDLETKISKKLEEIKKLENQIENSDDGNVSRYEKELRAFREELLELQETWQEQKAIVAQSAKINPGVEYNESILNGTREYIIEDDYVIEVAVLNAYYGTKEKNSQIIYDGNFATYGFDITATGSETAYCMEDGTPVYMIRELSNKVAATKEIYNKKPETLKFLGWSRNKKGDVIYQPGDFLKAEHAGAKVTLYAQWERTGIAINYHGNGENSGNKASQIINFEEGTVDENGTITITAKIGRNNPLNDGFVKDGSEFITWSTDSDIPWKNLCDREGEYDRDNISPSYEKKVFDPNEKITISVKNEKIYMEKADSWRNEKIEFTGDLDLYAIWKPTSFTVTLHEGVGIENVDGGGTYKIGQMVTITATTKTGYHWLNWVGNPGERAERIETITEQTYTFQMPEHSVDLTANGEANTYTIRFDPNGGTGHIDDIVTTYDTDITLPDGAAAYKKYTLDGVNVTADVISGVIPEDLIIRSGGPDEESTEMEAVISEAEDDEEAADKEKNKDAAEQDISEIEIDTETMLEEESSLETSDTEMSENDTPDISDGENTEEDEIESEDEIKAAHPLKRAYPSVFLGWALYDDKDRVTPTWKVGDTVRNLTAENNGVVTLYAVWDDCPWITAHDLYYTLKQAQDGFITVDEILSHASAVDREDGSPILPGTNPAVNNPAVSTSFTIPDYQSSEFTSMTHDAAISENLTVTDSVGNTYQKQIMVYIVDTTPRKVKPIGTTRFISEKYYNTDYEHGGLEDNSIWKTDPEYQAVLQDAFDNLKNDTPEQTYYFTHETILEMKQFIREHGSGNNREPGALQLFYDTFMEPNRIN